MTAPDPLAPTSDFLAAAEQLGVEFEEGDLHRLGLYLALLLQANESFNLTAITDPADAWMRHILDSLTLLPLLADLPEHASIADVGSGGGAPALPLAIVAPHLHFTLIESTGKKAAFLREAAATLNCANVTILAERAETVGQDRHNHRDHYDAVTARAVGRIAVITELAVPLAKVGGQILLIKGQRAGEELEEARGALHRLHAVCAGIVETPTGRIVVLEKARATPRIYPRRPGEPQRAPLAD
ncbi:MAG: 16S rRNA (guanine(527)-N(7))-methyltransferase RsmG [Planctomycetota bacterium]|nr:16S rRNA (guanine(527)-N(7))-methyltransferase RsmG [Planctomycetota bacterium]